MSPTLAHAASPAGDGSAPLLTAPLSAAGWHGQPIRRPLPRREVARAAASSAGAALSLGSGYGGSDGVRRSTRVAARAARPRVRLGCSGRPVRSADPGCGRVVPDQTRAASHRRRRRGDAAGRPRTRPRSIRSADEGQRSGAAPRSRGRPATPSRPAASTGGSDGMGTLPLVLLLAAGAALVALLSTLAVRRMRRAELAPRARAQAAARARSSSAMARRASAKLKATAAAVIPSWPRATSASGPSAIGYASGRDAAELERDAAAIEHACSERGWTLASVLREDSSVAANGHSTPALSIALDRLASGEASRLVTGRLDHLGRPLANLGRMLEWCAGHDVALVAVDVGLDTSTRDGQLAARCLLAAEHGTTNGSATVRPTAPRITRASRSRRRPRRPARGGQGRSRPHDAGSCGDGRRRPPRTRHAQHDERPDDLRCAGGRLRPAAAGTHGVRSPGADRGVQRVLPADRGAPSAHPSA